MTNVFGCVCSGVEGGVAKIFETPESKEKGRRDPCRQYVWVLSSVRGVNGKRCCMTASECHCGLRIGLSIESVKNTSIEEFMKFFFELTLCSI